MTEKRPILRVPQVMVNRIRELINDWKDKSGAELNQIQAMEIIAKQSSIYEKENKLK